MCSILSSKVTFGGSWCSTVPSPSLASLGCQLVASQVLCMYLRYCHCDMLAMILQWFCNAFLSCACLYANGVWLHLLVPPLAQSCFFDAPLQPHVHVLCIIKGVLLKKSTLCSNKNGGGVDLFFGRLLEKLSSSQCIALQLLSIVHVWACSFTTHTSLLTCLLILGTL